MPNFLVTGSHEALIAPAHAKTERPGEATRPKQTALNKPRWPVQLKLLFILTPCLLVVFALGWLHTGYLAEQEYASTLDAKRIRLEQFASVMAEPAWNSDPSRLGELLRLAMDDPDILRIRAYDRHGYALVVLSSPQYGNGPTIERILNTDLIYRQDGQEQMAGWLVSEIGADSIRAARERWMRESLILLITLPTALVAILFLFLARVVIRPLKQLLKSIHLSRLKGEYIPVCARPPSDEFGVIIHSYNELQQQLNQNHHQLKMSEQQFRNLYNRTPALLFSLSTQGVIGNVSEHFLRHLGYRSEQILGTSLNDLCPQQEDRDKLTVLLAALELDSSAQIHLRVRNAGGQEHAMRIDATHQGDEDYYLAVMTDITSLNEALHTIEQQANFDTLTGLPNRHLFTMLLEEQLTVAASRLEGIAVFFVDLDRFKYVNDTYGHQTGDELLQAAAQRIRNHLGAGDYVARLGGDEFAIMLHGVTEELTLLEMAEELITLLEDSFRICGCTMHISASIGIAICTEDTESPDHLLRSADLAMYRAKSEGRGRACVFVTEDEARTLHRVETEALLRESLAHGYFELHYQPVLQLGSNRLVGAEALVRLRHPQYGLLYPGDFIDVAEETGLIVPLGEWVLNEGLRQLSEWQRQFDSDIYLSLNVSSQQLQGDRFVNALRLALSNHQVSARHVVLEITETLLLRNTDHTLGIMRAIRALGCLLSMDDFGTGYSSLSYLQKFPLDILKIDRAFITDIESNETHRALVRAIINMSRALKLKVIVEGIETAQQLDYVRQLRCEMGQGYYFSKPVPAEEFSAAFYPRPKPALSFVI